MLRVSPQTSADNMEPHHETGFPTILSSWLREIVLSLPEAARTTIVELIIGTLLAGTAVRHAACLRNSAHDEFSSFGGGAGELGRPVFYAGAS